MVELAFLGAIVGVWFAYLTTNPKKNFRKKLLIDYESHARKGMGDKFVLGVAANRVAWAKSFSVIRKPFKAGINLIIETGALLLALMALINSLVNFHKVFDSTLQGGAAITFLGLIAAYIPTEWFLSGRIDTEMDAVLGELQDVTEDGQLDHYIAAVRGKWEG